MELWVDGFGQALVVLFLTLPLASLILLVKRRWVAVVPLATSLSLFALWFLYYATDWFAPVSAGVAGVVLAVVLLGWIGVWAAMFVPPRRVRHAPARSSPPGSAGR